jgi:hypothetical protein
MMNEKRVTLEELPMMMFLPAEMKEAGHGLFCPGQLQFRRKHRRRRRTDDAVYVLAEGRARMIKRGANGEEIA